MFKKVVVMISTFGLLLFCLMTVNAQAANITGVWYCDDGGKYYIHQLGEEVWWFGEKSAVDPVWSNVAHGTFIRKHKIKLDWADVPKGSAMGSGTLTLEVTDHDKMIAIEKTGGFGGKVWRRD